MNEKTDEMQLTFPSNLHWLIETYFSDPQKRIRLNEGEALMHEGDLNERLYLVLSGSLKGFVRTPDGGQMEAFRVTRHRFVGGPSFFSKSFTALTSVIALTDTEVAFIEQDQKPVFNGVHHSLEEQFMPLMVAELIHRQYCIQRIGLEKEKALKALIHSEKMVSLGQMSAGIAHELNNAVAVVKRNSEWFSLTVSDLVNETYPDQASYYTLGLKEGRRVSSREARQRAKMLRDHYDINEESSFKVAQMGISDDLLNELSHFRREDLERMIFFWEMGATLNDILVASNHAVHVVKSIKELGAQRSERKPGMNIIECIDEAVTLLASPLRKVTLETDLGALPLITGNKGELVQVFINIMNNACESMASSNTPHPLLRISARVEGAQVVIQITDNGPGIPPAIFPRIFEPSITTKTNGRTIGLGLGLALVQRIVDSYGGTIKAQSQPGKTVFTIRIPSGEEHAKA